MFTQDQHIKKTPQVMGILNLTPDSFYDGGRHLSDEKMLLAVESMVNEGVDILDLGACSTRPGALPPSSENEIKTLYKALELITRKYPRLPISIDTFRAHVVDSLCPHFDIKYINDISGGTFDSALFDSVAKYKPNYILMHTRGRPEHMQKMTQYNDIIQDLIVFFTKQIRVLHQKGVSNIIIDPGFGFAKTLEQNYYLLKNLHFFHLLDLPILVGVSRKSMIQKVINKGADECLNGSSCIHTLALMQGAQFLRVHDVKEAKEAVALVQKFNASQAYEISN